jgi:hypothetical protein
VAARVTPMMIEGRHSHELADVLAAFVAEGEGATGEGADHAARAKGGKHTASKAQAHKEAVTLHRDRARPQTLPCGRT